jgi:hypothetical protein
MEGTTPPARPRLRFALVITFGLWLMLRQVDGVLAQLQTSGTGGYGANDLGALIPSSDLAQHVDDLLRVWEGNHVVAYPAYWTYTGLDLCFIVAYVVLVHLLAARLPAASRATTWIWIAAGCDVAEDVLRGIMVGAKSSWGPLVWAAEIATVAKFACIAVVVGIVAVAWRDVGLAAGPGRLTSARRRALWRLRVPLVLLVAWGLFLILDPTGQSPDTSRRWFDDWGQLGVSAGCTLGAAALLGLLTWTTARRAVLAHFTVRQRRSGDWWRWAIAIAVLAALALWKPGWINLLGAALTLLALLVLEAFAHKLGRGRSKASDDLQDELAAAPAEPEAAEVRAMARALGAWPLVVLLIALASAWTAPPIVLFATGDDDARAWICTFLALACVFMFAPVVLWAAIRGLRALDIRWPNVHGPGQLELLHVLAAAACLVVCGVAIGWSLEVPPTVGVVAMTAFGIGALILVLGEAQRYGETHRPSRGLAMIGLHAIPTTALALIAFCVASLVDHGSYHAVRRNDATATASTVTLQQAFDGWVQRNCADGAGGTVPLVLVASHGGGIRATYWTTSVLTDLLDVAVPTAGDDRCRGATGLDRVFAMGGASGGSLGVTSFAGQEPTTDPGTWYRDAWGKTDLAAVPVSWGLLVDLPRTLVGWDGPDRAARLEQAWERRDPTLTADFFATQPQARPRKPLLILTGTQVESGCRLSISKLRMAPNNDLPGECGALLDRGAGAAPLTSEVLDYLCTGGSIRRSTAALLSARFPYVTPSGELRRCGTENRRTAIVDGGYAENTGGQAILNLWARLEPLVATYNAKGPGAQIVPVYVDVDNHYRKAAKAGTVGRAHELLVPLTTRGRPDQLDDRGVQQLANAEFSFDLPGLPGQTCGVTKVAGAPTQRYVYIAPPNSPGIPAPLAWTLSDMAMDDLDDQRADQFKDNQPGAALRDFLQSGRCVG